MAKHDDSNSDSVILSLAGTQNGIVTRRQLLGAGVNPDVIARRRRRGWLRALHAGVYVVGAVEAARTREVAALLACKGGVLSFRTAGSLWEVPLPPSPVKPIEVTNPVMRRCGRRDGIRAHRSALHPDEIVELHSLPVTSLARTLLDLSTVLGGRDLERALAAAERSDASVGQRVEILLARYPRRAGTRALRRLLAAADPAPFTRSEAEELLLALIRKSGLPQPEMNVMVRGYEVDCYWRSARLVIEVDGYAFHGSARAFVRDRQRDSALAAAGIRVLRLSWQQISGERERTLVQLAQALGRWEP